MACFACPQDKNSEVRKMGQQLLTFVTKVVPRGAEEVREHKAFKDVPKASSMLLQLALERAEEGGVEAAAAPPPQESKPHSGIARSRSRPAEHHGGMAEGGGGLGGPLRTRSHPEGSVLSQKCGRVPARTGSRNAAAAAVGAGAVVADQRLLRENKNKDARERRDLKHKWLRADMKQRLPEYAAALRLEMQDVVKRECHAQLFHRDFKEQIAVREKTSM